MNIFDYLYESNGIHYFKEPTTLTIADIDKDQIYRGQAQKNFDKGKSYDPLPVLIFPDANSLPNEVFRWDGKKYYIDYDYRGQKLYEKATGNEITITELGALPATLTAQKWPGEFYEWSNKTKTWVLNQEKKDSAAVAAYEANKSALLAHANEQIDILQDELELELAEDEVATKAQLKAWKVYRVVLNKVDTAKPVWPKRPDAKD